MNYYIQFHPDVEEDLLAIHLWYERKSVGLGDEFLQIFYSSSESLTTNPSRFSKIYNEFRRYLLHKFPYALYYLVRNKQVLIMGLFHHARNPQIIKNTLQNRID